MISVLIIGLGRFGRHMAIKFQEQGNDVMAVEKDETRADEMAPVIQNIQIGDATNEDFLRSLGVGNYDVCVVGIGESFQTALEITVHLKDLGAKYVVARATRDIYKKLLLRNGADHVVYAEREVAERLAVRYGTAQGWHRKSPWKRSRWADTALLIRGGTYDICSDHWTWTVWPSYGN